MFDHLSCRMCILIAYLGKTMRCGLLGSCSTSVSRRSDTSGRATSSSPTGIAFRVLATERESFRAQTKAGHTVRYNLLQGVEKTHFCSFLCMTFVSVVFCVGWRRSFRQMSSSSIIILFEFILLIFEFRCNFLGAEIS